VANNGEECLKKLMREEGEEKGGPFDVILMDCQMPGSYAALRLLC
jgi:CheY-like chemotaxis protein